MVALRKAHHYRLRRSCILFARALSAPAGLNDPDQLLLGPPPHPIPGVFFRLSPWLGLVGGLLVSSSVTAVFVSGDHGTDHVSWLLSVGVILTLTRAPCLTLDLPHCHKLLDDPGCCPGAALLTSLRYGGAVPLLVGSQP